MQVIQHKQDVHIQTSYTETQQNVYSHSTTTFTDNNGVSRTVKFYK